jgi:hypothetical protein
VVLIGQYVDVSMWHLPTPDNLCDVWNLWMTVCHEFTIVVGPRAATQAPVVKARKMVSPKFRQYRVYNGNQIVL